MQQFGSVCASFHDSRIYSYSEDSKLADFCIPLRSEWKLLNRFFSTCTSQASNIIIVSSSPDDGIRIWRHLIEQTIRIRRIKGDIVSLFDVNGITTSYSGEIDSLKQLSVYLRNASSVGGHHVFLSSADQPTMNIFKISMRDDDNKIDISWKLLHELLQTISQGKAPPNFACCSLTKLMQPLLESEFLSGDGGCRKISLMISGTLLKPFLESSGLGERNVVTGLDGHSMERILKEIGELADESPDPGSIRNSLLCFEILQLLRGRPDTVALPSPLAELRTLLEEHPEHAWTQSEMAQRCNCSPTHLVRLFHNYFHTTPRQYLLDLRIHRARQLLADETRSIKEIAAAVGCGNALNFSTCFRRRQGVSPREYRKQLSFFS